MELKQELKTKVLEDEEAKTSPTLDQTTAATVTMLNVTTRTEKAFSFKKYKILFFGSIDDNI